jgi:hypothetical protein
MVSFSGISGSVTILKIFYLNLEQPLIVGYQLSYQYHFGKFLTKGLRESPCIFHVLFISTYLLLLLYLEPPIASFILMQVLSF